VGSGYGTVLDVFADVDGELSLVGCGGDQMDFTATAGTTYHFMVSAAAFGGDLVLSVLDLGAPLELTVRVTAALVDRRTGTATLEGTATCNQRADIGIWGQLRQKVGRGLLVRADFFAGVTCNGTTPWRAIVRSDQGAFGQGFAEVLMSASGCSQVSCDDDSQETVIRLRGSKR
jgi:hypothetical protein